MAEATLASLDQAVANEPALEGNLMALNGATLSDLTELKNSVPARLQGVLDRVLTRHQIFGKIVQDLLDAEGNQRTAANALTNQPSQAPLPGPQIEHPALGGQTTQK